eukprot:Rmarinus@m.16087
MNLEPPGPTPIPYVNGRSSYNLANTRFSAQRFSKNSLTEPRSSLVRVSEEGGKFGYIHGPFHERIADGFFDVRRKFSRMWKQMFPPLPPNSPYRSHLHKFMMWVVESSWFNNAIMGVILVNTLSIAVETFRDLQRRNNEVFEVLDLVYLSAYSAEFFLKLYAEPTGYWKSKYNHFDFFILATSYLQFLQTVAPSVKVFGNVTFLRVLRALRSLRALRGVGFIRSLQVIVNALGKTLTAVVDVVVLLFLVVYIFGIVGYYFFGAPDVPNRDAENWGSLELCFLSLFTYTTADGWTKLQERLDDRGQTYSKYYTILFLFIGHFIFTNLFIGIVIQNIEEASEEERTQQEIKKRMLFAKKKAYILAKQEKDYEALMERQRAVGERSLDDLLFAISTRLRHDELVPMVHLSCNMSWLEAYLTMLKTRERGLFQNQQLSFDVANTLAAMLERRLEASRRTAVS